MIACGRSEERDERFLHVWLEQAGYAYDMITDLDLHRDPKLLDGYEVLVINGHSQDGRRGSVTRECGYPAWELIGLEFLGHWSAAKNTLYEVEDPDPSGARIDFFHRRVDLMEAVGDDIACHMIYWERPRGGRVFNAGSLGAGWGLSAEGTFYARRSRGREVTNLEARLEKWCTKG